MVNPRVKRPNVSRLMRFCGLLLFCAFFVQARADFQFDVFPGFDGNVREAHWFPITIEVKNDGPTFAAVLEIASAQMSRNQSRRVELELPTGTLKRVTIPVFSSGRYANWSVRLLTQKGKILDEKELSPQILKQRSHGTILLGALARTASGSPSFPQIKRKEQAEIQPTVARLQTSIFPDNPVAFDGLQAIYINSERALDLKSGQVNALIAWMQSGGHLIVSVEQKSDIAGNPWLRDLLPCELTSMRQIKAGNVLQDWLKQTRFSESENVNSEKKGQKNQGTKSAAKPSSQPENSVLNDEVFESASMETASGILRDGRTVLSAEGTPLIVEAPRGQGKITVLLFSAERQPFVSWQNRSWFWATLLNVSPQLYSSSDYYQSGGYSADGVFGSMIESKQIRKLPLAWLLLLLVVYLVVIGPLDQIWLKRINRQMLTWITFPIYVVAFSGLIYFIGFKLRAGDSEYNELHIVDILPSGEKAVLRGRTYASLYSPANQHYRLEGEQFVSSLRGEYLANWGSGQENSQANVLQHANSFSADVFVPVWTSQLYVNDWLQPVSAQPITIAVSGGKRMQISVQNNLERKLMAVRICSGEKIYDLGELGAKETKSFDLEKMSATPLRDFVRNSGKDFFTAVERRRQTFGSSELKQNWDLQSASAAASFISYRDEDQNYRRFVAPGGLDLSPLAKDGSLILLAWDGEHSLTPPMNRFNPRRHQQNTLLRMVVPADSKTHF